MANWEPGWPELTDAEKDVRIWELEQKVAMMEQQERTRRKAVLIIGGATVAVIAVVVVVVVALVFFIAGQNKESPALAESMLQAMLDQDAEEAYALIYPDAIDREEFSTAFGRMRVYWFAHGGQDTFTITRVRVSINANPASSRYESEFLVRSGEARFIFQMIRVVQGESAGIVTFQLS